MTTSERMRGVANRIMFSRYYIIFYLVMTGLSLGTVILSLLEGEFGSMRRQVVSELIGEVLLFALQVGVRLQLGISWKSSSTAVWFWRLELVGLALARYVDFPLDHILELIRFPLIW